MVDYGRWLLLATGNKRILGVRMKPATYLLVVPAIPNHTCYEANATPQPYQGPKKPDPSTQVCSGWWVKPLASYELVENHDNGHSAVNHYQP